MKLKIIVTGATGMVGEGVMHECLQNPEIEQVLVLNRRPGGVIHPKLKEILVPDFLQIANLVIDFTPYQACFFCAGISSVGISQEEYYKITYELTLHVARTMVAQNPEMVFCYVTGAGTDSTEKGRMHWARVKGKTENDLLKLPFKKVYMFRPAFMIPTPGLKNTLKYYKYVSWLAPGLKFFFPNYISTLQELAQAMIKAVQKGYPKPVLEVKDIKALAKA